MAIIKYFQYIAWGNLRGSASLPLTGAFVAIHIRTNVSIRVLFASGGWRLNISRLVGLRRRQSNNYRYTTVLQYTPEYYSIVPYCRREVQPGNKVPGTRYILLATLLIQNVNLISTSEGDDVRDPSPFALPFHVFPKTRFALSCFHGNVTDGRPDFALPCVQLVQVREASGRRRGSEGDRTA